MNARNIDIKSETLIPLTDVPDLDQLPRGRHGERISYSTICDWARIGIGGVRLEVLRVGARKCTTLEALQRFFEELSVQYGDSTDYE